MLRRPTPWAIPGVGAASAAGLMGFASNDVLGVMGGALVGLGTIGIGMVGAGWLRLLCGVAIAGGFAWLPDRPLWMILPIVLASFVSLHGSLAETGHRGARAWILLAGLALAPALVALATSRLDQATLPFVLGTLTALLLSAGALRAVLSNRQAPGDAP